MGWTARVRTWVSGGGDFLHSFVFRLVLGSTQSPIKWLPGAFPGGKGDRAWDLSIVPCLCLCGPLHPIPPWAFMTCNGDTFTLALNFIHLLYFIFALVIHILFSFMSVSPYLYLSLLILIVFLHSFIHSFFVLFLWFFIALSLSSFFFFDRLCVGIVNMSDLHPKRPVFLSRLHLDYRASGNIRSETGSTQFHDNHMVVKRSS